jgi:hypothetical protein
MRKGQKTRKISIGSRSCIARPTADILRSMKRTLKPVQAAVRIGQRSAATFISRVRTTRGSARLARPVSLAHRTARAPDSVGNHYSSVCSLLVSRHSQLITATSYSWFRMCFVRRRFSVDSIEASSWRMVRGREHTASGRHRFLEFTWLGIAPGGSGPAVAGREIPVP